MDSVTYAAATEGGMATKPLGPHRKIKDQARWDRGQCMNGGCTRIGRFRDTADCYRCWVGVKFTSIIQRLRNVNGRSRAYVGIPIGFTREEFIKWAMDNPPPAELARPSIDRIVAPDGYTFSNIRWIEFRVNARGTQRDVPWGMRRCQHCHAVMAMDETNFNRSSSRYKMGFQHYCRNCGPHGRKSHG